MVTALVTHGSLFAGFRRRQVRLAVPRSRSRTHRDPDDREGNQGRNLGAAPELSPRAILDADTRENLRGKSLLLGHKYNSLQRTSEESSLRLQTILRHHVLHLISSTVETLFAT